MSADPFRTVYVPLTPENQQKIVDLKAHAARFMGTLYGDRTTLGSRELSLAQTKLEEAVMWATKHFSSPTLNQPAGGVRGYPGVDEFGGTDAGGRARG